MEPSRFDDFRREHQELLSYIERLEAVLTEDPAAIVGGDGLTEFLRYYDARIAPHLEAEADEIYPLLDRYLPEETASADSLGREQETLRGLIATLRARRRDPAGGADAACETIAAANDVVYLLRDLIRKEDRVIHPLLRRLLEEPSRG